MSSSDLATGVTDRWRLELAYDGTTFRGFAPQPGQATVVAELQRVLCVSLRLADAPEIVGAGRTDAGVHALAQVVHVDLPRPLFGIAGDDDERRLLRSLNSQLAGHVVVIRAQKVEPSFHARFAATSRAYRYLVVTGETPTVDSINRVAWFVRGDLDRAAMDAGASALLGVHDFRAFCRRRPGSDADVPIERHVISAAWRDVHDEWSLTSLGSTVLRFDIRANAFCHQMVRSLTSCLVAVGRGTMTESDLRDRLEHPRRDHLPAPAPARGLCFVGVGYDELADGPSNSVT